VQVISVINYKGGVGKTTVTANLGAELARRGLKILLIDLDPQSSLTFCFYHPDEWRAALRDEFTIKQWFDSIKDSVPRVDLSRLIVSPRPVNTVLGEEAGRLDLIASHLGLIHVDFDLARGIGGKESEHDPELFRIRGALADALREPAFAAYDFVLIDCPPNFNVVTQTALLASDYLLIPAKADYLSTLGIEYLYGNVEDLVLRHNEHARRHARRARHTKIEPVIAGVIFTMIQFYANQPIATLQFYIDQVRSLGVPVFDTLIRENMTAYAGGMPRGVPTVLRDRIPAQITKELRALASEFLDILHGERAAA
jgi:chromosome partitioning protein